MEEKINIAEILKDKPQGTKLYSILSDGECFLNEASEDSIYVDIDNRKRFWCFTVYGSTHSFPNGCVLLFPSREMRDWEKFSWKKGDVLISDCGFVCIFKEWASDDYTKFNGCYFDGMLNAETAKYSKLDNNTAYGYIREIENRCGGKLNLETLEIEKQTEFKDGDIVHDVHGYNTYIIKEFSNKHIKIYAGLTKQYGTLLHKIGISEIFHLRLATEEEKQQLFSALAKEGKAWDAEKKQIVDLKPKVEFKPFDKIVGFEELGRGEWVCDMFSHYAKDDGRDVIIGIGGLAYLKALPFNEETAKLIGTTDDWEG